jgi:MFS family permease
MGSISQARNAPVVEPQVVISQAELNRARWAGFVGTMLENFDMVIYTTATALVFNSVFFPHVSPSVGYIASFATFATGFAARPLGGLFFARYGDSLGRKFVLVATLYLMGSATVLIGLLPTYAQIGLMAPLLLVICRIMQGFGAGAEMASAVVLLTEFAPAGKRGETTSLVWVGAAVGFILGAIVFIGFQQLPRDAFMAYGWRLVFLSSIVVTLTGWIIRRRMTESPVFASVKRERKLEARSALQDVLANGRRPLRRVFLITVGSHAQSYFYSAFIGAYLVGTIKIDPTVIPKMVLLGGIFAIAAAYFAGRATDKWGRKPVNVWIAVALVVFTVPAFLLMQTGNLWLIAIVYVVGFILAVEGAVSAHAPWFAELFGSRYRYAGVAIGREFSAVCGGGIAPTICSALLSWFSNSFWPVAIYMMLIAGISLVESCITPETRDRDLVDENDAE